MRSGADHAEVETPGVSPAELLGPLNPTAPPATPVAVAVAAPVRNRPRAQRSPVIATAPTSPPPAKKEGDVVENLRGDRLEERRMRAKEQP
jgi:hypothetical protein